MAASRSRDDGPADLFAEERQTQIVKLVQRRGKVTVAELSALFGVCSATIRTDLRHLHLAGRVQRTHGGAIRRDKTGFELDSGRREVQNLPAKQAIGTAAAQLVEDGDRIILDTGTTTRQLALALRTKRNITVVTNDIEIGRDVEAMESAEVVLLGGTVRKGFHCTVGPPGAETLARLSVDKAFLGTNSLSLDHGATTPDQLQAESKRAMAAAAQKVIVLCDSTKVDKVSFAQFTSMDQIDVLVCDRIPARWMRVLRHKNVDVIVP